MKNSISTIATLLVFLTALTFVSLSPIPVFAEDPVDEDTEATKAQEDIEDLQEKIEEYEEKIGELQGKANTLSNEIETMNSQINLTELRIQSYNSNIRKTEEKISKLTTDIDDLGDRIEKLVKSIGYQEDVLDARMRERYKSNENSPLIFLFGADTLSQLIHKAEYLRAMELYDNKLIEDMDKTKNSYNTQKQLFEDKREEESQLKAQLVVEKTSLDNEKAKLEVQKSDKNRLLEATENDEAKYQGLLAEALKELNQITGAVSVLINQKSRVVEKGEAIGIQGNSGYSTGAHLHFGVYEYGSFKEIDGWNWYYSNYVDPLKKLKSKNVYWNTGCESSGYKTVGKGDWAWPMSSPTISQGFGNTCWIWMYGGKPHPALDMYGSSGSPVYAVDDGDAFFCRNCLGDGGNGVFIFHDDDYMTVYWHLQ